MGFFAFPGNNIIYSDMLSKLPDGSVYFKDKNIIPYMEQVTYVEIFNEYPIGTAVDVYINDRLHFQTETLSDRSIYIKFKTPYGRFKLKTVIAGSPYREEVYYAINLLAFCVIIARTYEYDYISILQMFGNLYAPTTQDELIEKKYGWIFDFIRSMISTDKYRQDLVGDLTTHLGAFRAFFDATLEYALSELIKSFSGSAPIITNYRLFEGYIGRELSYPYWTKRFPKFWFVNQYELIGITNLSGLDVSAWTETFKINGYQQSVIFPIGTVGTAAIVSELQKVWKGFVDNVGDYIRIRGMNVEVIADDAGLGLPIGTYTNNITENAENVHAILMSKKFKLNTIRINILGSFESEYERQVLIRLIRMIVPAIVKVELNFKSLVWQPLLL